MADNANRSRRSGTRAAATCSSPAPGHGLGASAGPSASVASSGLGLALSMAVSEVLLLIGFRSRNACNLLEFGTNVGMTSPTQESTIHGLVY